MATVRLIFIWDPFRLDVAYKPTKVSPQALPRQYVNGGQVASFDRLLSECLIVAAFRTHPVRRKRFSRPTMRIESQDAVKDPMEELSQAVLASDVPRARRALDAHPELKPRLNEAIPNAGFGTTLLLAAVQRTNKELIDCCSRRERTSMPGAIGGQAASAC